MNDLLAQCESRTVKKTSKKLKIIIYIFIFSVYSPIKLFS